MSDVNLSQSEADALIALKKYRINENAKAMKPVFKTRMFAEVEA
jgi:hypothetical protein